MHRVSLELAQALKAAGVKQCEGPDDQACFVWAKFDDEWKLYFCGFLFIHSDEDIPEWCHAYTSDELFALLGERFGALMRFDDGTYGAYDASTRLVTDPEATPVEALGRLLLAVRQEDMNAKDGN